MASVHRAESSTTAGLDAFPVTPALGCHAGRRGSMSLCSRYLTVERSYGPCTSVPEALALPDTQLRLTACLAHQRKLVLKNTLQHSARRKHDVAPNIIQLRKMVVSRIDPYGSSPVTVPFDRTPSSRPVSRTAKVILDLIGAACLILVLSPLLLAIAVLVKLDGGPVLYAHPRIGMGKRRFRCLKFRSMKQGSAVMLEHLLSVDPVAATEWNATQKLRNDPRVTRIGAFLRETSLDELPQLFNVLRLEMSLVGPRPIVDDEIEFYGNDIDYYYATRPGLTGLWQVNGRSNTTYRQRVQLDTWYVKAWTLWQDVVILGKTVPAVLKRTGAI